MSSGCSELLSRKYAQARSRYVRRYPLYEVCVKTKLCFLPRIYEGDVTNDHPKVTLILDTEGWDINKLSRPEGNFYFLRP